MAQNELVTASTPPAATQPLAVGHTSLMHGWVPLAVQVVTAVVLVLAAGWRSRHWQRRWLPTAAAIGATLAWGTRWYVTGNGLANERPPSTLWIWVALTGAAATVLILGWRSARWWRRGASLLAVPLCLLSATLTLNLWVGYFPTVQTAWNQLTSGPLPDQADQAAVAALAHSGVRPSHGTCCQW